MQATCRAQLILSGRFDPHEFSRQAGMQPTGIRQRGDFVKGSIAQHEKDQWIVATLPRPAGHCEDALFDLFSLVAPHAQALHQAARLNGLECVVRLFIGIVPGAPLPVLEFSPEILRRVEMLGAALAIHVLPQALAPLQDSDSA